MGCRTATVFSWRGLTFVLESSVRQPVGESKHLYRFSRSRRVFLYKLIGRDDEGVRPFSML